MRKNLGILGARGRASQRLLNDKLDDIFDVMARREEWRLPARGFDSMVYLPSTTSVISDMEDLVSDFGAKDAFAICSHNLWHFFLVLRSREAARKAIGGTYHQDMVERKILQVPETLMRRFIDSFKQHDYHAGLSILGSLTKYATQEGVIPVEEPSGIEVKDDAPLYLNDSSPSEMLRYAALPNEVARAILFERRQNSAFVSWPELRERVPSATQALVKKLQKRGVKLSKESLFSEDRRKFLMLSPAHPDTQHMDGPMIGPDIDQIEPRFRKENEEHWPRLPSGRHMEQSSVGGFVLEGNEHNNVDVIMEDVTESDDSDEGSSSEDDYDDDPFAEANFFAEQSLMEAMEFARGVEW